MPWSQDRNQRRSPKSRIAVERIKHSSAVGTRCLDRETGTEHPVLLSGRGRGNGATACYHATGSEAPSDPTAADLACLAYRRDSRMQGKCLT